MSIQEQWKRARIAGVHTDDMGQRWATVVVPVENDDDDPRAQVLTALAPQTGGQLAPKRKRGEP